ncbi:MAG: thiosulfate sulfurtransferase [Solirubrobacterales bacterium]|jgi:thiosulfate/3-mercaptopyruvate sulfurtransferase|nr:thiosulfate sulfurtransferase [Solirubrobacterales bacterium]
MPGYEHEGEQRSGHIPGAAPIPWAQAVNEDGRFKAREDLEALYGGKGVLSGDPAWPLWFTPCRAGR